LILLFPFFGGCCCFLFAPATMRRALVVGSLESTKERRYVSNSSNRKHTPHESYVIPREANEACVFLNQGIELLEIIGISLWSSTTTTTTTTTALFPPDRA
jgi:hypothetical protein